MFKNILMSGLLCSFLCAESFDDFLQRAVQNSPYLHSSALAIAQVDEQGKVLTRYENPSLELEISSFEPDTGASETGYRVGFTQPLRLWNIADNKQSLADANRLQAHAEYGEKKAKFIRDISLEYTLYAQSKMALQLAQQELAIAKKIYEISLARFEGGTISQGIKLQAQVDYEMSQSAKHTLSLASMQSYFTLLEFAGINQEIQIQEDHNFSIQNDLTNTQNPALHRLKSSKVQALADAQVNSNSIEFVDLFAELESEPEQDILRVGVNLPLTFFNNKSQEKTIATLQANRIELLVENEINRLNITQKKLQYERSSLEMLKNTNAKILQTQLKLLKMYEDGYKIANINLLQLQDIKNKVIQTKRALIQINTALNQNAIYTNYTQGSYND